MKTRALWTLQIILAALFLFAGAMKFIMPASEMTKNVPLPVNFIHFIGVVEILGGLGLVLPGLLKIRVGLTAAAAAGLVIIMAGAVGVTLAIGQTAPAFFPGIVGVLAALVAIGRSNRRVA